MAENKRKSITKKIRFEVFKRDKFTCQYCGAQAPDVILEVDHINPVANGGTNDIANLVTSCRDCNRGKSKTLLSDDTVVKKRMKQSADIQDRREQLQMLQEWQLASFDEVEHMIDIVEDIMREYYPNQKFNDNGRMNMKKLIKRFGFTAVKEACEISFSRYDNDVEYAFNKIGGICYNKKIGRTQEYYK